MVYFIQSNKGKIKIGHSRDWRKRLATMQSSSPGKLELLATQFGDSRLERELHEKFKLLRRSGEWFSPGKDLLGYIANIKNTDSANSQASHREISVPTEVLNLLRIVGDNIRNARIKKGLSEKDFAIKVGASPPTYKRLEEGNSSVSMGTYCKALYLLDLHEGIGGLGSIQQHERSSLERIALHELVDRAIDKKLEVVLNDKRGK